MGSQTLEILRQGVWASLTGGWFYDPHQTIFCNAVHLYLWLGLVCAPFIAYLYFPATWLTWCVYCVLSSLIIFLIKLFNMALHRLYDRAQTTSEANLKHQFFKVTKETEARELETGIELKVLGNDGLRNSVEQAINEASEENSMLSMDNANSIIDLKVDVHRKNSSESIEMMFYADSMISGNSQQDQHSLAGSTSVSKSLRSNNAVVISTNNNNTANGPNNTSTNTSNIITTISATTTSSTTASTSATGAAAAAATTTTAHNELRIHWDPYALPSMTQLPARAGTTTATTTTAGPSGTSSRGLWRKSSEEFKRRHHQRRRLERQNSLDAAAASSSSHAAGDVELVAGEAGMMKSQNSNSRNESSFLHPMQQRAMVFSKSASASRVYATTAATTTNATMTTTTTATTATQQRLHATITNPNSTTTSTTTTTTTPILTGKSHMKTGGGSSGSGGGCIRLQRHRSSETHDERLKQLQRGVSPLHLLSLSGSGSAASDESDLELGGSASNCVGGGSGIGGVNMHINPRLRTLQSCFLGSSSDVFIEDDSYTKSDFNIEKLDGRSGNCNSSNSLTAYLQQIKIHYPHTQHYRLPTTHQNVQQQQQQHNHKHQHQCAHQQQHQMRANMRKDSTSTMSALQLPATGSGSGGGGGGMKRRRHSNATALFKSGSTLGNNITHAPAVRRIKSTALEISCPRPSVSNLSPHPNSVEAISGQQQIKNPASALLPPPSKCLVRNPHLNLCPKFGGSYGGSSGSGNSLNFAASTSGSTTALIEPPVYPIAEQMDEKMSLDSDVGKGKGAVKRMGALQSSSSPDLEITDIDADEEVDEEEEKVDETEQGARGVLRQLTVDDDDQDDDENIDDDDEVDDVPMRRRHKALGCSARHSAESDVGDILADDDEFKDFDDNLEHNLEHILNDLQQTHNELDELKASYAAENIELQLQPEEDDTITATGDYSDDGEPTTATTGTTTTTTKNNDENSPRERLHSTDSETDNNGSRSPLLSGKHWQSKSAAARVADKVMRQEIAAVQQRQIGGVTQARGEGDSGCPSSDCEQVSASSKDMLLSGMDATDMTALSLPNDGEIDKAGKRRSRDLEQGIDAGKQSEKSSSTAATSSTTNTNGKNLGAIPKVVKYREIDEITSATGDGGTSTSNSYHLHKRRSTSNNTNSERALLSSTNSKGTSRTSSTTSSRSISADSFSADIHKMLWLMHGGAVDDRGRPIAGIALDGTPITAPPTVPPPNMSTPHFQFYQEAIQSLSAYPQANSSEGLWGLERIHFRDVMRRNSKQISEPGGNATTITTTTAATSTALAQQCNSLTSTAQAEHDLANMSGGAACRAFPPVGVVSALYARNAPTLSIQGLLNAINDERHQLTTGVATTAGRVGGINGSIANGVATTITTNGTSSSNAVVVGANTTATTAANTTTTTTIPFIESYCDYWRPSCMLPPEKPTAPKSFYKYHFKCCGYARDFKIAMDRLELLALFDRDLHWLHVVLAVLLCAMVAYLGATILQLGYYKDVCAFLFCVVLASAQYSLVKSVQPDAASPIHGFNKIVAYSRAIYFSLCGALLLFLERLRRDYEQNSQSTEKLTFFGISYAPGILITVLLQFMYVLLLCFPLIFSLGLCPQVNTFLMYLLEQVDMHVFGGNAAGSLLGAFLCVLRSIVGVSLLYGPLYAALAEARGTQYIVFSIFCAMLIPLGYHLSRSASDFSHLWALVKHCIVSTYRDDDDELSAISGSGSGSAQSSNESRGSSESSRKLPASTEHIEMATLETEGVVAGAEYVEPAGLSAGKRSKSKASSLGSSSQTLAKGTSGGSKKIITAASSYASMNVLPLAPVETLTEELKPPTIEESVKPSVDGSMDDVSDKVSTSSTTNACDISTLTAGGGGVEGGNVGVPGNAHDNNTDAAEMPDPLPKKLQQTVHTRLKNDLVVTTLLAVVVLGLHCSTVFTVLQPDLNIVLYAFCGALGLVLHYIIPQMRKHMPWLCFARPLLRQKEFGQFEVSRAPKVMWFEKVFIYLCMIERNVLFPLLVISALTADAQLIAQKYGIAWGTLIVAVCALKFIRNAYSDPTNQYLIVLFTVLIFRADFSTASETFLIDYFFISIAFRKCCDFLLKLQFIVTYIAPWQITWGSAFHAFAQPFSVPHSAMLFVQAAISAVLSTPLNPFLGSAIFLTSYVRPIKFWERDYNTRRIDHSNTRLSSQLERDLGADDNNLNSIFYEHLTRSLQHSLCGDLLMGRWGNVNQGDCFVLASDYLNCLVHIIELGNGLCTFQMRGLEFRGTYCQQREVEAITEDVEDNDGCCCCDPGHLPRMLSANAMFATRWLAWQVVAAQYVLEGYSISDNLASATLQVFEYRKVLITYYIKSIIYYVIKNPKLEQWLASGPIQEALQHTLSRQFVDLDPIFNYNLDEDFDFRAMGITRSHFCYVYLSWINFCYDKRLELQNPTPPATTTTAAAPATPAANSYNDSKSTPNLSANPQTAKSQSQQQLRSRPQKSATMSGSSTVNNHSSEHITTSQSFANISRQTSESAPGLSSVSATQGTNDFALHNSTATVSGATNNAANTIKLPLGQLRLNMGPKKPLRKEDSPTTARATTTNSAPSTADAATRDKQPSIKLKVPSVAKDSPIVSLCLALGLLARRSLATASHSSLTGVEFFLHGLHALFKGDFRITSPRDEWVFADMELLHAVVAPAVKMALKLQQDHISNPDEFLDPEALYEAIDTCSKDLVISHEADPVWRSAVLRGAPNLLALRHVMEDGSDEYRIIRLTKRFLSFRVIKLNRECVRGLWAGQQQELIYLRNRNPERGSIQNAKQALRNIINSSCDQPIGYPIYVSPLTTSYADTNEQLCDVIGGAITLESIRMNLLNWWQHVRERCRQGCSSGSALEGGSSNVGVVVSAAPGVSAGGTESGEIAPVYISPPIYNTLTVGNFFGMRPANLPANIGGSLSAQYGSDGLAAMRNGLTVLPVKPCASTTLLVGLLNRERESERERELLRDVRGLRKSQTHTASGGAASVVAASRAERERRATLPIASTSLGVVSGSSGTESVDTSQQLSELNAVCEFIADGNTQSPRYTKISCSSGSLGIGNIITTPGEYPRKSKGPICLTAAAAAIANEAKTGAHETTTTTTGVRKPNIELHKKVIIVDDTEIYDALDMGRRIDVTWPSEQMRANGGRLSWKDWVPRAGMVGYVVHYWIPNHADPRFRSHVNRIVYLIEIGEHYVPVGEYGLREYNQVVTTPAGSVGTPGNLLCMRRISMQLELEQLQAAQRQAQQQIELMREDLTPILGSSLESPTSQLASTSGYGGGGGGTGISKSHIRAVSSTSSSDDDDDDEIDNEVNGRKRGPADRNVDSKELLAHVWKFVAASQQQQQEEHRCEEEEEKQEEENEKEKRAFEGDEGHAASVPVSTSFVIYEPEEEETDREEEQTSAIDTTLSTTDQSISCPVELQMKMTHKPKLAQSQSAHELTMTTTTTTTRTTKTAKAQSTQSIKNMRDDDKDNEVALTTTTRTEKNMNKDADDDNDDDDHDDVEDDITLQQVSATDTSDV